MPFAFPGQQMPDHIGRRKRMLETAWGYAPATGGGVPETIDVDGVTYTRIYFGGLPLDQQISSQPLYGRAA